jgi:hypothetical protein
MLLENIWLKVSLWARMNHVAMLMCSELACIALMHQAFAEIACFSLEGQRLLYWKMIPK